MRLALAVYRYSPWGGRERVSLAWGRALRERGHELTVFSSDWPEDALPGAKVVRLAAPGSSKHAREAAFASAVGAAAQGFDAVLSLDRLPGLDVHWASDPCFVARNRERYGRLLDWTPRVRRKSAIERAVFGPRSLSAILIESVRERERFERCHGTPGERFHLIPPCLDASRLRCPERAAARRDVAAELGFPESRLVLAFVASSFRVKGLDRALGAVARLPDTLRERCEMLVVGAGEPGPYRRLAETRHLGSRVRFLGSRADVPRLLAASDVLVHPARSEMTGMVLLEALAAGTAVVTTDVCGYAGHVERSGSGLVLPSPFDLPSFARALAELLASPDREALARRAVEYARSADLTSGFARAAEVVERTAARTRGRSG